MSVSKKFRAGLAITAVLASCQLVGCGSDTVDSGGGGASGSGTAGRAGGGQAGKAGSAGRAGSGHAGEADAGSAGEVEMGGGPAGGSGGSGTAAGAGGKGGSGGAVGGAGSGSGGSGGTAGSLGGAGSGGKGGSSGAGGSSAGAGGNISIGGGTSAGAGGASAGSGGASAGSGGASAGSGGGSSLTCGNGTVDPDEVCDPKFTVNNCGADCKAITSAACITCESAPSACAAAVLTCDNATGNATGGPASGVAKSNLCNETLDCVRDSGCAADSKPVLQACYCGSANMTDCNNGLGNGPCKAALERSLETTSPTAISMRIGNAAYGGGVAMKRITCDQVICPDFCF